MNEPNTQEWRDPALAALFGQAGEDLADEAFTRAVLSRTRRFKWRILAGLSVTVLLLLTLLLAFSAPLIEWTVLTVELVTTPLVDLGEGWPAWVLAPINTLGTLLLVLYKVLRVLSKKALGASYVN